MTDAMQSIAERVWAGVPEPRVRLELRSTKDLPRVLVDARSTLYVMHSGSRSSDPHAMGSDSAASAALLDPVSSATSSGSRPPLDGRPKPAADRQHQHGKQHSSGHEHADAAVGPGHARRHDPDAGNGRPNEAAHGHGGGHDQSGGQQQGDGHEPMDMPMASSDDGDSPEEPAAGHEHAPHHDHDPSADPSHESGQAHGGGHEAMDMQMPAGLPLANEAEDRDGLILDILHFNYGPALPYWPAGLQLNLTVQGDVVTDSGVTVLTAPVDPRDGEVAGAVPGAARALDSLFRLFAVAGADRFATTAQRLRDDVLAEADPSGVSSSLLRLQAQVSRARLLRSMLSRIDLSGDPATGLSGEATDVWSSCTRWLTIAVDAGKARPAQLAQPAVAELLEALPSLVKGRELAEVRLVVAALDPDLDELDLRNPSALAPVGVDDD